MALYQVVLMGSTPIGAPIVGWISANIHPRWGIGVGAIASIIVSIAALIWVRKHWNVKFEYRREPRPQLVIIGPAEHAERKEAESAQRRKRERTLDATTQEHVALSSAIVAVPPRTATPEEP